MQDHDLSARLDRQFLAALAWFEHHAGEVGPRPWRSNRSIAVNGIDIPLVAQRGIHKPRGSEYALSITATRSSVYAQDGQPVVLEEGTWILQYAAHAGADGVGYTSPWNRALIRNMSDRIPVGVFVQEGPSGRSYRNLGLALVDHFDARLNVFTLRGPVCLANCEETSYDDLDVADSLEWLDTCIAAEAESPLVTTYRRQRQRQDDFRSLLLTAYNSQCALTAYDAPDTLQAAHIVPYRAPSSQAADNGILLRADIHILFDRYLLSIHPDDHIVHLAPPLRGTRYEELDGHKLRPPTHGFPPPSHTKLSVHWSTFEHSLRSE